MAASTKTRRAKTAKVPQQYVSKELYSSIVTERTRGSNYRILGQEETPVRISILRGQYSFTYIINRRREGVSKNGTPWKRWEMFGMLVASTKAIGKSGTKRLNLYAKYRISNSAKTVWYNFHNCTSAPETLKSVVRAEDLDAFNTELEDLYRVNIGEPTYHASEYTSPPFVGGNDGYKKVEYAMHLAYPLTRKKDCELSFPLNSELSAYFRNPDAITLTRKMFGRSCRKDLVRAVSHAITNNYGARLSVAKLLKGIVPVDWLVMFLTHKQVNFSWDKTTEPFFRADRDTSKIFKDFFSILTPSQQKRLLLDLVKEKEIHQWMITDTMRSFRAIQQANFEMGPGSITGKKWSDIHDTLADRVLDIRSPEQEIEKVPLAKEISELETDGKLKIILPRTNRDLRKWGKNMHHCIGSYDYQAVNGDSVFLGLIFDNEMIGNAQIRTKNREVIQIFGKHNQKIDAPILKEFTQIMTEADILKKENIERAAGYYV